MAERWPPLLRLLVILRGCCSAASAAITLNTRPPLVSSTELRKDNLSVRVVLRQGGSATELARAACEHLGGCSTEDHAAVEAQLAQAAEEAVQGTLGEQILRQVRFGWHLLLGLGLSAEARLQLTHAFAAVPHSRFLRQELAAAALASARNTGELFAWGADGFWALRQSQGPEALAAEFELWESYAAVRFEPPVRPLEDEEGELLAMGLPPYGFIPSGEIDPHDGTSILVGKVLEHRLRHDIELMELLGSLDLLPQSVIQPALDAYRTVLEEAPRPDGPFVLEPTQEQWKRLHPFHNRRLYVKPNPGLPGPVVMREARRWVQHSGGEARSLAGGPLAGGGVLVVDGLLSQQALQAVREFSELSTIWFQERPAYLGAAFCTGFATPLLEQIARELRASLPDLLCDLPLANVWAYKYDDELQSGIAVHADAAAVNVNLWLTPDEDNLDPDSGGLVVFDATVDTLGNLNFSQINHASPPVTELLQRTNWRNVTVPHRQNRAVIFDSGRLHGTQSFTFRRGLRSRRINLTFLFGPQGAYCPLRKDVSLHLV